MKTFTVKIPTSLKEFRLMAKERSDERYRHNVEVLNEFKQNIVNEVERGYWRSDISDEMRKCVFGVNGGKIHKMYFEAKNKLK